MTGNALPTGRSFSREMVAASFTWYGETPQEWSRTKFLVPNGWTKLASRQPPLPGTTELTTLAIFEAPGGGASIRLQAVRLDKEITAELWLRHYLILAGNRPDTLVTVSPVFADSLSDFSVGGEALRARIAVRIHGNILFLVAAACPASTYPQLAEAFGVCIVSFSPTSLPSTKTIEARRKGKVGDILTFEYPSSWASREVPPLEGKLATDLIAITQGQPTGLLRVKTCSKDLVTRMELQIENALEEFATAGVTPAKLLVNRGVDIPHPRFLSGFLQVFEATTQAGQPQELWLVVLEDAHTFVTIGLLTPDRRQEFLLWAWNRSALDIVTRSLS